MRPTRSARETPRQKSSLMPYPDRARRATAGVSDEGAIAKGKITNKSPMMVNAHSNREEVTLFLGTHGVETS
jgi:hypothetical protein